VKFDLYFRIKQTALIIGLEYAYHVVGN